MDPAIAAVAASAATALIGAMTRDSWDHAKQAVVSYWRRRRGTVGAEDIATLEQMRAELVQPGADHEAVAAALSDRWRQVFEDDLRADPEAADDLRELLTAVRPASYAVGSATHHGSGDINVAGERMTIIKR